jgi:hypothetical protein
MAAPVNVTCTANNWVKVATGVTSILIKRISVSPNIYKILIKRISVSPNIYKITHVNTGGGAPTDDSLASLMFSDSPNEEKFSNAASSDIYVKAVKVDGEVQVQA